MADDIWSNVILGAFTWAALSILFFLIPIVVHTWRQRR